MLEEVIPVTPLPSWGGSARTCPFCGEKLSKYNEPDNPDALCYHCKEEWDWLDKDRHENLTYFSITGLKETDIVSRRS